MIKTKMRMSREEIIKFQPKAWTQCLVMNTFITHNCSILQNLEETWPELSQWDSAVVLRDHLHQWASQMLVKLWARISIQLNTGNQLIKELLIQLLLEIRLNQEDHFGPSIDKLIAHQEDNIRQNSLTHTETMVTTQEMFCLMMLQSKQIETLSSLSEPPRWPTIFQATMVSYLTLILIKMQFSNQKVKKQEKPLSNRILLKINQLNFQAIKDTRQWALWMIEELWDQIALAQLVKASIERICLLN